MGLLYHEGMIGPIIFFVVIVGGYIPCRFFPREVLRHHKGRRGLGGYMTSLGNFIATDSPPLTNSLCNIYTFCDGLVGNYSVVPCQSFGEVSVSYGWQGHDACEPFNTKCGSSQVTSLGVHYHSWGGRRVMRWRCCWRGGNQGRVCVSLHC